MAAYAALVSLMNNIDQIQSHTRLPISLDKDLMESLHLKVSFFIEFLETYNNSLGDYNDFVTRITYVAYEAENIIETHVVDTIESHSRSINAKRENMLSENPNLSCINAKRENMLSSHFRCCFPSKKVTTRKNPNLSCRVTTRKNPNLSCLLGIEQVFEDMELMKQEAKTIGEKIELDKQRLELESSSSSVTALTNSSSIEKSSMVGFDDHSIQIMDWLTGYQSGRQVISVTGMGGVGKTTLARNVYDNQLIVQKFDVRAWVSISHDYSLRQIVLRLLSCMVRDEMTKIEQKNEEQLKDMLYQRLLGMKYLVVLDDMWSVEAWESVRRLFPDKNNGSRIIVTTRISSVATYFGSYSHRMNLLDEEKSWNLFRETVFGREGCSLELEEVGRKIVKNCNGLPLSIVVIGGLLSKSIHNKKYWESIVRDTKAFISLEGGERCMRILSLSYHSLPIHLKPCFLYMGIFPEDGIIHVTWLIKLWVAEGFLKPNSSKELEVIGTEYLDDLISRNLILVHGYGSAGNISSCMMHDLLRDVCLKEAQNDMFLCTSKTLSHDKLQCISSQRRIVIHKKSSEKRDIQEVLKSIKSGWLGRSLMCDVDKVLSLKNHRLLRILKVCDDGYLNNRAKYSLDDTFRLVNSRFIAINTVKFNFPSSFNLLWNIQSLTVNGPFEKSIVAPLEIWEMVELRHVKFQEGLYLRDPPPSQQTNTRCDVVMNNLQTLQRIKDFVCSDEVVKRIPNIKKLKLYYFTWKLKECPLKNLFLLKKLESLSLWFKTLSKLKLPLSQPNITFSSSLKKLSIDNCSLRWDDDMAMIGSLPHLQVLKLFNIDSGSEYEWVTVDGEFCCLKYLELYRCSDLVHWRAHSSHFPRLQYLQLDMMRNLEEIPSGIGEIPTFQRIRLQYCPKSVVISAKEILEAQEDFGNDGLRVDVVFYKQDLEGFKKELEGLASENFIIRAI